MTDAFNVPVDIANRALQHCGAARVVTFDDDSKNADEVAFCYDKLRIAELRRNVWRFAIRKVAVRALQDANASATPPITATRLFTPIAWSNVTAYTTGAVVSYQSRLWEAVSASTAVTPGADAADWEVYCGPMTVSQTLKTTAATALSTAYFSGELIYGDGAADTTTVYRSLKSGNSALVSDVTAWKNLGIASSSLDILYPIGSGPKSQNGTRNVYRLPNGFLRQAPADPKEGSTSWLGAPSGLSYDDFNLEGNYFTTTEVDPIILRFVADVTTVPSMDPMFCEGLAARIGLEVCEALTQSTGKLQSIGAAYNRFMSEARIVNGIETGSTEPPIDDYIACRV